MKLQMRLFLEAVKQKRVTRGRSGQVSEARARLFQRKATSDFKEADAAGFLEPYEDGDAVVIRLSEAGEKALEKALAERAGVR